MFQLLQKFTIHPVGQGFFYSGNIQISLENGATSNFNFVFDCGSMNKESCADEVIHYHNLHFPENVTLDLLVISHFDQDHVNHIYKLLDGRRKVKKIVAPFLNFNERFLLLLKWITISGTLAIGSEELFFINLVLDPEAALSPLLDEDDGEIIFIISDPNNPPFDVINADALPLKEGKDFKFHLDFGSTKNTSGETTGYKTTQVTDSERTTLKFGFSSIMEFLFYKKEIGEGEVEFYQEVYELFINKYRSYFKNPEEPLSQEITNVIKDIRSATVIEDLFTEAKNNIKFEPYKYTKISDLNTSALCMLHTNIVSLSNKSRPRDWYNFSHIEINKLQKFEQLPPSFSRIAVPFVYRERYRWYNQNNYPNTLLTSDSFLLSKLDVEAFYKRFKNYWDNYWLFQIPHHGSDRNSDVTLLSRIPYDTEIFINYGVIKAWGGNWRHPSAQLITNLVATGHSVHFSPINEVAGMEFTYIMRR